MDRAVDLVVISPETSRPELVVEVKLREDLRDATVHLATYMTRVGAPLGLVIGTRSMRLLRDSYRSEGPAGVEIVGEFETRGVPELQASESSGSSAPFDFERRVQAWLESLAIPEVTAALPEPMRSALRDSVVPVVETGHVLAAGPRSERTVSPVP